MANRLTLGLSDAHYSALVDFREVIGELLVRDRSALILGGGSCGRR